MSRRIKPISGSLDRYHAIESIRSGARLFGQHLLLHKPYSRDLILATDGKLYLSADTIGFPGHDLLLIAWYHNDCVLVPRRIHHYIHHTFNLDICQLIYQELWDREIYLPRPLPVHSVSVLLHPTNVPDLRKRILELLTVLAGIRRLVNAPRIEEVRDRMCFNTFLRAAHDILTLAEALKPPYLDRALIHRNEVILNRFSYTQQVFIYHILYQLDRTGADMFTIPSSMFSTKRTPFLLEEMNNISIVSSKPEEDDLSTLWLLRHDQPDRIAVPLHHLIPWLQRQGAPPANAAQFLYILTRRFLRASVHIPHYRPRPVRLQPEVSSRGTPIWIWRCSLCKQHHRYISQNPEDYAPPESVPVCTHLLVTADEPVPVIGDRKRYTEQMTKLIILHKVT